MSETSSPSTSDDASSEPVNVIIIGAGIAGLAAAQRLLGAENKAEKINVTILEASSRAGGRIHSVPFGNGISEQGATWIHGIEGNPVYEFMQEKNIEKPTLTKSTHLSTKRHYCYTDGQTLPRNLVKKVGGLYYDALRQSGQFNQSEEEVDCSKSIGEYLEEKFDRFAEEDVLADILRYFVNVGCNYNACDTLHDLMLRDEGEYIELEGYHPIFPQGYSQVIDTFLEKLPTDCVVYNSPVKCIHWNRDDGQENTGINGPLATGAVKVECTDGRTFPSDYIIVTVSLGVLKENQRTMFNPQLPKEKQRAIERMGFGTVATISLEYETQFWTTYSKNCINLVWRDKMEYAVKKNPSQEWFRKLNTFYQSQHSPNVLVAWLSGNEARQMETLPEEEIIQKCTDILQNIFSDCSIPKPKSMLRTQWYTNPHFRGSYSYMSVGSEGADIDILAEPITANGRPVILFAGEATHRYFYSTTHGAMLSGQREADSILKNLGSQ
ncbi:spermine oxidase-like [Amphiura filiformis]|uniref:spermine oxidase-like n=1 Tax=Amphiura filiformis TaxID=82378 RepID=UPI003B20C0F1